MKYLTMESWLAGQQLDSESDPYQPIRAEERVVHIDALPLYKRYTNIFSIDDVPEEERKEVAREVATVPDGTRP